MVQITPRVYWAQNGESVWLTFDVQDATQEQISIQEKSVSFSAVRSKDNAQCAVELALAAEIDPEKSTTVVRPRNVFVTLHKKELGFWNALLATKGKHPFLYVDFTRWRDEDEDEEALFEEGKYADMMEDMADSDAQLRDEPVDEEGETSEDQ